MLAVVQFVGCLVACAATLNLGQFVVWAAFTAIVWAVAIAASVVWAALTASLGTAVAPACGCVNVCWKCCCECCKCCCCGCPCGHSGRVVTLSPLTSEAGVRFLAWPQVGSW